MQPITSNAELAAFCASVEGGSYLTVDTEFLRDKTYYPKLCLLQLAGEDAAAIIDPLAPGIDLAPALALMQKASLVKVFHAARQDIEIFHLMSGKIPFPIFDTQIAASVCGYGESVSYENLVNKIAQADLDKSSRFTDWSARPLSEKQLAYALSDVTHLRVIYKELSSQLEKSGRLPWLAEEEQKLTDPAIYQSEPADAWKRIKYGNARPKHLVVLRELARWREIEAKKNNVPRGRIIRDETLVELALSQPRKEAELSRMRGMERHMSREKIEAVLACVQAALELPPSEYPQVKRHQRPVENVTSAVAMLQLLLKVTSDVQGIAAHMIAGKDDLEAIALGDSDVPALHGWRYDIFGQKARALMEGRLRLSLDTKKKEVVFEETV